MRVPRRARVALIALGLVTTGCGSAAAWFAEGHQQIAEAAVETLPERVPEFFRSGAGAVRHSAVDPDLEKHRALVELREAETPEHYLDRERLPGAELPRSRYLFLDAIRAAGHAAADVGTLPYAIVEGTERLTLAFAEHRRWPDNVYIQRRALVYAGNLAHYSADLCQPLHTTEDHDGRARADGSSPFSGIHQLVDGLFTSPVAEARLTAVPAIEDLHRAVLLEFEASHDLVDRVYELEPLLRPRAEFAAALDPVGDEAVAQFARDRFEASVRFTASLFLYAWDRSRELELPSWHDRGSEAAGGSG